MITLAAALAALCTAAAFLGRYWPLMELLCHFRFQYLIFLAFAAVAFLVIKARREAEVAGVFALANLAFVLPAFVPPKSAEAGPEYRAAVFNVHRSNSEYGLTRDFILESRADLAVLLEVDANWVTELSPLSEAYPYSIHLPRPDCYGVSIFSKYPAAVAPDKVGPEFRQFFTWFEVALPEGGLTMIAVHTYPPSSRYLHRARDFQLRELARLAASAKGDLLLLGDLNASPWSPRFRDLLEESGLGDSRRGFGVQPTWPSFYPWPMRVPIDHCLASEGMAILGRRVGPDLGSDHLPVIVDFAFARTGPSPISKSADN